jgi:hypothetical protein
MDSNCECAPAAGIKLPLKSLGGRHAPLAARVLAYTSSLKRKTGQCRLLALQFAETQHASHFQGKADLNRAGERNRMSE